MAKLIEIKTESTGLYYIQVAYYEGAPSANDLMNAKAKAKATDNPPGMTGIRPDTISTPKLRPNIISKQLNQERWVLGYALEEEKE